MILLPPWQHYDEPSHFEYAWLIAEHGHLPQANEVNNPLRREIVTSMIEHDFYWNLPQPNVMTDEPIWIGYSQLEDPPLYYLLVSLPLRLVHHLDITSQLYVARLVSLGLFVLTIAVCEATVRDLTASGSYLRWLVPLTLILIAPAVDLMTAVNNDVGAIFIVSLFLLYAVRTLRFGLTPLRLLGLLSCAGLGLFTKNTAAITLALIPLVLLFRIWIRFKWRWRWLLLAGLAAILALLAGLFEWHDAAYWYRIRDTTLQSEPTRVAVSARPGQPHALSLIARPGEVSQIQNPLLNEVTRRAAGQTITIGGWIWADQATVVDALGLRVSANGERGFGQVSWPVTVTSEPSFIAWTYDVPPKTSILRYFLTERSDDTTLRITLSQPFVITGTFPEGTQPSFDDQTATSGTWAGLPFTNMLRNPSADQIWPHLRPEFHNVLKRVMPRPPAQMLPALFDWHLSWPFLIKTVAPSLLYGMFNSFAWGHITLDGLQWSLIFQTLGLASILGAVRWWVVWTPHQAGLRPTLTFLATAILLIWLNALIWPLPMITWASPPVPTTRYVFPTLVPMVLLLAGGCCAIWPRAYRKYGIVVLILSLLLLNIVSVWTISSFYQTVASAPKADVSRSCQTVTEGVNNVESSFWHVDDVGQSSECSPAI